MVEWVGGEMGHDELLAAFDRLDGLPNWIGTWDGSRPDLARLKNLTSTLIGRFAASATTATREAADTVSIARFGANVVVPRETQAEIAVLKGVVAANIMSNEARQPIYVNQREVLTQLCEVISRAGDSAMEPAFADDFRAAENDTDRMRTVIDQVASLTDQSALAWHARLCT
jgi:dGTPase